MWELDKWGLLERFLMLGTEGGTFYVSEKKLTKDNATNVMACIKENGMGAVNEAVRVSHQGLAHRNDQALFVVALAISHGDEETRRYAAQMLPSVARTGTHLFQFVDMATSMRGWGSLLKSAVRSWYQRLPVQDIAFQATKYAQRDGWSQLDVMRLARPLRLGNPDEKVLYDFINGKSIEEFPRTKTGLFLEAVAEAKSLEDNAKGVKRLVSLIEEHNLAREVLPTWALNHIPVWEAMLPRMPLTATIRNLGKMSSLGMFKQIKDTPSTTTVLGKLSDGEYIRKSRIHPMSVLFALRTYESGHGFRGKLAWHPNSKIAKALDGAFYKAFKNVIPTGKAHLLALDVSASMSWGSISGTNITPAEASGALALVTANAEEFVEIRGFATTLKDLKIKKGDSLTTAAKKAQDNAFGGTDCAQPMIWAKKEGIEVEVFVTLTDNETWAGQSHPHEALEAYRQKTGIPAKMVVVGMTSTGFSIANPKDAGSLDVVGFSADTPIAISNFARG